MTRVQRYAAAALCLTGFVSCSATWGEESPPVSQEPVIEEAILDETLSVPPESEVERWTRRVEELEAGLLSGELTEDDANALFEELTTALRTKREEFRRTLVAAGRGRALGEAQKQREALTALYRLRLRLIDSVSGESRAVILGSGFRGVRELNVELEHVALEQRYQRALVPVLARQWFERLRHAPLPAFRQLAELVVVTLLFRIWRRWARDGLQRWRNRLVESGRRTPARVKLARWIWYVDQVRRPLEWLLLAEVVFYLLDLGLIQGTIERISVILRWTLLAWFLVRLVHALSLRGKSGTKSDVERLRLRSLRTLAAWFVLLGLGLALAESYAGQGTLYAWVWMAFQVLTIPVVALLVIWWRQVIFERLEREFGNRDWARRLLGRRRWIRGFANAALGGMLLLGLWILRGMASLLARSDWGTEILSYWYRRGIAEAAERRAARTDLEPLPDEIRSRLLESSGETIEKVGREELRQLAELVELEAGGLAVVIGDRGFGKSVLLERLCSKIDRKTLVIDCPPGGAVPLFREIARKLDLDADSPSASAIAGELDRRGYEVVAVDNYHRLARPVMGGQDEMDVVAEIGHQASARILWVVTLNRAAWRYLGNVRSHRTAPQSIVELPAWTEQQIGELIEMRSRAAGIEADFGQIVLPRRLDEEEHLGVADHNRAAVYRLIWDIGVGSPAAAVRIWADSLGVASGGRIVVQAPSPPRTGELETLGIGFLLVLRVIVQTELATMDDIVASLRMTVGQVRNSMRLLLFRGWVEPVGERYRISDTWYGTVVRALSRRNLIAARRGVGVL